MFWWVGILRGPINMERIFEDECADLGWDGAERKGDLGCWLWTLFSGLSWKLGDETHLGFWDHRGGGFENPF